MIPKIAHWIWLYEPLPEWAVQNIAQFQKLHPGWTTIVWHQPPREFPKGLRQLMDKLEFYASRSDILRYWLLNRFGGIYLDCDNYALRYFGPLLVNQFFTASYDEEDPALVGCGLMGSEPESYASGMILESVRLRASLSNVYERTSFGPKIMQALFARDAASWSAKLLPYYYFYLLQTRETAQEFLQADEDMRSEILRRHEHKFINGVEPYSVHAWGIEDSSTRKVEPYAQSYYSIPQCCPVSAAMSGIAAEPDDLLLDLPSR